MDDIHVNIHIWGHHILLFLFYITRTSQLHYITITITVSTLGIVEAVIFILHKYYEGLVIQTEKVFAEVHFTLFFVVIFNTVMSSLLYVLSCYVANNQWSRTEAIDLDHYVAVRKEFEDVNRKIEMLKVERRSHVEKRESPVKGQSHVKKVSFHMQEDQLDLSGRLQTPASASASASASAPLPAPASVLERKNSWMREFWMQSITRKQVLVRKQRELLVQVRFHDLRVHFIEAHKLPPNFR